MNRIDALFESAQRDARKVFVPFLTAGDPDMATTMRVADAIEHTAREMGVPMLLELGFPYSDPLADGPTIQSAYARALDRGTRVDEIFDGVRAYRRTSDLPIVAMVSFAIVHRRGAASFFADAQSAGFDGVIVPDLPVEESVEPIAWGLEHDFKIVQLVAPTTRPDRLPKIAASSTGFLYYISVTGITGERRSLPTDLVDRVSHLRRHCRVPICVGFGVSEPEHVEQLAAIADGVIVGSALVRRVGELPRNGDCSSIISFVSRLIEPLAR